ncbi:MAG: hypothetical protein WKF88_08505 [Ferruginibacter sp.]
MNIENRQHNIYFAADRIETTDDGVIKPPTGFATAVGVKPNLEP